MSTDTRPATFDRLKKKQPLERKVTIPLDQDALDAYDTAVSALERAKTFNEDTTEAEAQVAEARANLQEHTVTMVFRAIGRKNYDALIELYPPTEEQIEEFRNENLDRHGNPSKGKPAYDIDKFAPALVAASCVEPEMTLDQVNELFDEWNATELAQLWVAALEVNTHRRVVSLGNG